MLSFHKTGGRTPFGYNPRGIPLLWWAFSSVKNETPKLGKKKRFKSAPRTYVRLLPIKNGSLMARKLKQLLGGLSYIIIKRKVISFYPNSL